MRLKHESELGQVAEWFNSKPNAELRAHLIWMAAETRRAELAYVEKLMGLPYVVLKLRGRHTIIAFDLRRKMYAGFIVKFSWRP